ncbi:hypothetical protein HaLaN_20338, partial [Haematococcus lacustris]
VAILLGLFDKGSTHYNDDVAHEALTLLECILRDPLVEQCTGLVRQLCMELKADEVIAAAHRDPEDEAAAAQAGEKDKAREAAQQAGPGHHQPAPPLEQAVPQGNAEGPAGEPNKKPAEAVNPGGPGLWLA